MRILQQWRTKPGLPKHACWRARFDCRRVTLAAMHVQSSSLCCLHNALFCFCRRQCMIVACVVRWPAEARTSAWQALESCIAHKRAGHPRALTCKSAAQRAQLQLVACAVCQAVLDGRHFADQLNAHRRRHGYPEHEPGGNTRRRRAELKHISDGGEAVLAGIIPANMRCGGASLKWVGTRWFARTPARPLQAPAPAPSSPLTGAAAAVCPPAPRPCPPAAPPCAGRPPPAAS